jgi:hypothetical protein
VYRRLKSFIDERLKHETSTTFLQQFRFMKGRKNRDVTLRKLKTWNMRLNVLSESKCQNMEKLAIVKPSSSFSEIRQLFDAFVRVIGKHWNCNCPKRHNAMVCLRVWPPTIRASKPKNLEFIVLISRVENQDVGREWLEATVRVQFDT